MSELAILATKLEVLHGDVGEVKDALRAMSVAITKLALVEERQAESAKALERAFQAIERLDQRLDALEAAASDNRRAVDWVDRAVWGAAAAAAMYAAKATGLL